MIVLGFVYQPAVAQCPPIPTHYEDGTVEGLVADGLAAEAAVAAQGEGKFIVIYAKPIGAPGVNGIYVHRFEANGDCICETRDPGNPLDDDFCPALLTVTDGVGRGIHQRPSIAMNRGADGRAEWFAAWTAWSVDNIGALPDLTAVWQGPIL